MNELHLENAFPDVPPMVHARVLNTLQEVKTVKKAKPVTALVLAAVLTLALVGAAYAAVQRGVLRYLFGDEQPTAKQRELVQTVGTTHTSDGVTTTLTDVAFDGRELSLGLQFDLTTNAFVVVDHVTINGVSAHEIRSELSDAWLCSPTGGVESPQARGVTVSIDPAYYDDAERDALTSLCRQLEQDGRANVEIALSLLEPKAAVEQLDLYSADAAAMWTLIDSAIAAGSTPISSEEPYEVAVGSAALGDSFHQGLPAQHFLANASSYVEFANMNVLDAFSLNCTISASDSADAALQAIYQRAPINDGRVHITFDEVRFTPFATDICLSITPESGVMTNDELASLYKWFAVYDEKHTPLTLLPHVTESSSSGFEVQADGTLVYRVALHLGALVNPPQIVNLVPYNEESSAEHPLWDYAIPIVYTSEDAQE